MADLSTKELLLVAQQRIAELEAALRAPIVGWVRDEDGNVSEPDFLRGAARPPRDLKGNYRPVVHDTALGVASSPEASAESVTARSAGSVPPTKEGGRVMRMADQVKLPEMPEAEKARFYFCNKCGYFGHVGPSHPSCDYNAVGSGPYFTVDQLRAYALQAVKEDRERAIAGVKEGGDAPAA